LREIGVGTERLRAVLDTNVFVSAFLSRNPTSPTQELIRRWVEGEFILLVSDVLLEEVAGKLVERGIEQERVIEFLTLVGRLAEWVDVPAEAVRPVIADDPDDDHILACAVVGKADYLISYDPHFDCLEEEYEGVRITKALPFLWAVRGDHPPKTTEAEVENGSVLSAYKT
jgi:putative PIN family toxin of toxin-antitoxin system